MSSNSLEWVTVGRVSAVFGIKGWLKVHSHTAPKENIQHYNAWYLCRETVCKQVEFDKWQSHGKGMIAHIAGCDDRNDAAAFVGADIAIAAEELPELESGEYYWQQLAGLQVYAQYQSSDEKSEKVLLGRVSHLLETGANDVLVVKSSKGSLDKRERLIPYLPDSVVLDIDLDANTLLVDWNPEF